MSFLFKSNKSKNPNPNALPSASRDIRSSDGITPTGSSSSQIPTLNGIANSNIAKPGSPTPGTSVNNSLSSVAEQGSRPGTGSNARPSQDEKAGFMGDGARSPEPEQKSIRSASQDAVCH